jgi:micrococcal nuclease|tara:strand:- start:625 stop:1035 length:411 start_codon:yes stop_codon:yes gene_type:complete
MFEYKAQLIRVVDGDTLDCRIDLGFSVFVKKRVRLMGIDTWESRTRDLEEKKKGLAAKSRLIGLLQADAGEFTLISYGVGKFGRVLGEIEVTAGNVCDILVEEGHAYAYFGGNKEEARAKAAEILAENKETPEKDL